MSEGRSSYSDSSGATDEVSDDELLARVARRDRDALTQLYRRYYSQLLRFLQRLTGDLESAQEAVNDVMLVVWNRACSFGGRSKVSTWILGIAYRKALKVKNRAQKWRYRFKAADWAEVVEPVAHAGEHTSDQALKDLLYRAILRLPAKQRAVVELTYFFGYSYEEIAEIVQCPENTVKTRMFHARARLREILPELGQNGPDV